jgi:hypothetical protein
MMAHSDGPVFNVRLYPSSQLARSNQPVFTCPLKYTNENAGIQTHMAFTAMFVREYTGNKYSIVPIGSGLWRN